MLHNHVIFNNFVFNFKVTLIDSHAHALLDAGAVVAQSRISDIDKLCDWYIAMCVQCFSNWISGSNSPYELAYLYQRM